MQKKKSGVKKCLEILPLRGGGGVGRLMANAILNFHFDYVTTSLTRIYVEASANNHIQTDVEKGITGGKGLPSYHIGILYQFC